jgi:hypothetical protein
MLVLVGEEGAEVVIGDEVILPVSNRIAVHNNHGDGRTPKPVTGVFPHRMTAEVGTEPVIKPQVIVNHLSNLSSILNREAFLLSLLPVESHANPALASLQESCARKILSIGRR